MTDMLEMPRVSECSVTGCGYNHDGCHAFAITVGGSAARCDTFIDTTAKGGLDRVIAQVGACHRTDCTFNSELECGAPAIRVAPGKDIADCMTYEPR
ncbi:DUF1540 domain-containing protein [Spirilliplanes yamanashiensis]|uniref:DUF1540 domain-containing protein n=1 Tax=Spirilliplanes yamanashiensis TaxID=42233 RepID=A0A8J4DLR9_9ACTN|nr:DUF1540 domain-containing protein [Spirilliplanes yamanashiensis]MDP9818930.1 hypothetical protein [Spirilliplanes yamanashiensis]GIJ05385.1 hypothetical protein Sya03_47370 [Spirilliplanes yamanashiensis]